MTALVKARRIDRCSLSILYSRCRSRCLSLSGRDPIDPVERSPPGVGDGDDGHDLVVDPIHDKIGKSLQAQATNLPGRVPILEQRVGTRGLGDLLERLLNRSKKLASQSGPGVFVPLRRFDQLQEGCLIDL